MSNLPNPIYPKKRSNTLTLFHVGDTVRLKDNVILVTLHGEIPSRTIGVVREAVEAGVFPRTLYKVQFENHPAEEYVFEYELEKVVYEENPIYDKKRNFKVGDRVRVVKPDDSESHGRSGVIFYVRKDESQGPMYRVKYTDYTEGEGVRGRWFSIENLVSESLYTENPIYPKERGPGFHVGDRVKVVGDVGDRGKKGHVTKIAPEIGMIPVQGYVIVLLDSGAKGFFSVRSLQKIGYEENPIYRKTRPILPDKPKYKVGQATDIFVSVNEPPLFGYIFEVVPRPELGEYYYRIGPDKDDPYGRSWFPERVVKPYHFGRPLTENPIYPKHRFSNKFKIGDRVITTNLAGGRNKTGRVYNIHPPDNISDEHSYDIELPGGAWSQYYESSLMLAPEENPAVKRMLRFRYGQPVKVGWWHIDPKYRGKLGMVLTQKMSHSQAKVRPGLLMDEPERVPHYYVRFPGLPEKLIVEMDLEAAYSQGDDPYVPTVKRGLMNNPIYPKKRMAPRRFSVGDMVKIQSMSHYYNRWVGRIVGLYEEGVSPRTRAYTVDFGPLTGRNYLHLLEGNLQPTDNTTIGPPVLPRFKEKDWVTRLYYRDTLIGRVTSRKWDGGHWVYDAEFLLPKHKWQTKTGPEIYQQSDIREQELAPHKSFDENPIYPKKRPAPIFKVGDLVKLEPNHPSGIRYHGVVKQIVTDVHNDDRYFQYIVEFQIPKHLWRTKTGPQYGRSMFAEWVLLPVPSENPIYKKKRFARGEGDLREKLLSGKVFFSFLPRTGQIKMWEKGDGSDFYGFRMLHIWDDPAPDLGEWLSYLMRSISRAQRELNVGKVLQLLEEHLPPEVGFHSNPIYPKRRPLRERKIDLFDSGDQVTVTEGHAAGSSGEVILPHVLNLPGYIRIKTVSGRVYDVHRKHVVRTHPRYQNNQPRRWGVWPAEDPPVGEVVIDSHPTSERHGTTAVVVKRGKSTTGEGIYLLKFRDGFERWYTSMQIRRMPSKLGWKAIQENKTPTRVSP